MTLPDSEARQEIETFTHGIVGIFTASKKKEPMKEHDTVRVIAGKGLANDRYAKNEGIFSNKPVKRKDGTIVGNEERQITFISLAGINEANGMLVAEKQQPFTLAETRRNVVIDMHWQELNELAGQKFRVGEIEFEGVERCEPCKRPGQLVNKDGFLEAFENKGGLRARVLNSGELKTGDLLVTVPGQ